MLTLALLVGLVTAYTGPAFEDGRLRRRARRDYPSARVVPLVACQKCLRIGCPYHL